ncbi:hypothetical protein PV318_00275 [Streptomyces sp. ME02-6991-2B]|nr:hypothetical protein [Streptomyces sp. ME02-6991-2B]
MTTVGAQFKATHIQQNNYWPGPGPDWRIVDRWDEKDNALIGLGL